MALETFRRIQVGLETVRGTAVAADTKILGQLTMTPQQTIHAPRDEMNSLAEFSRDVVTAHGGQLRFQGDATYEQMLQFLSMCLIGGITPSTPIGATASRDWDFTPSLVQANTQDSFTIEYGDNTQFWETEFVVARSIELGLNLGDVMSMSVDMFGRFPRKTTVTGSIANPTVTPVLSDGAKLFIDTTWANLGTTEFNAMLAGGVIRLNSGLMPVRYADGLDSNGRATFSAVAENRRSHSMDLDLIVSDDMIAQFYDAWTDRTDRAIRIVIDAAGDSIETGFNHELEIDMFGRFTSEPVIFGARDGENLVRVTFTSRDDRLISGPNSGGNELTVRIRNDTTAI